MSSRHFKPEIRVTSLHFSPTGKPQAAGCWCWKGWGGRGGPQCARRACHLCSRDKLDLGASGWLWAALSPVGRTWASLSTLEGGTESCDIRQATHEYRQAGTCPEHPACVPVGTVLGGCLLVCPKCFVSPALPPPLRVSSRLALRGCWGQSQCPQGLGPVAVCCL